LTRAELYEQSVQNGIALLDAERPGWRSEIDLKMLDIAQSDTCVLGQLYDGFANGVNELELLTEKMDEYGFSTPYSYKVLTKHWKRNLARSA
jgi:hypothetical protein